MNKTIQKQNNIELKFTELTTQQQNEVVGITQFNQQQNDIFETDKEIKDSLIKCNESYVVDDDNKPMWIG